MTIKELKELVEKMDDNINIFMSESDFLDRLDVPKKSLKFETFFENSMKYGITQFIEFLKNNNIEFDYIYNEDKTFYETGNEERFPAVKIILKGKIDRKQVADFCYNEFKNSQSECRAVFEPEEKTVYLLDKEQTEF